MKPLVSIVGPTASGKSALALSLARRFNGEIIGADSRQVYRFMDIGTAKPSRKDMKLVPHHMIDIIDPDESYSQAKFQNNAYRIIDDLHQKQKVPFLVGGSGLWVWSVLEGWKVPRVKPNRELREELEDRAGRGEGYLLYRELEELDPIAAGNIDPRNIRRVIRALEVVKSGIGTYSSLQIKNAPPYDIFILGLTAPRKILYGKIDARVDGMIEDGLVEEVRSLLDKGYSPELPSMSGIGYRQICSFLNGEIPLEEAARKIKTATHQYVRRQYNWFKLSDDRIHWFDISQDNGDEIESLVETFLN